MSANRFHFAGLNELREALRSLPSELASEGSEIVQGSATEAKDAIVAAYPEVSGELRRKVTVERATASGFSAGAVVKSKAKHAHLYEYGSELRYTDAGVSRGRMPQPTRPTFVPIVIRKRREMYERLKGMLQRHGLLVSGDAG